VNSKVIALNIRSKYQQEYPVTTNTFLWICLLTATVFGPNLGHHQDIIIQQSEYIRELEISEQELSPFRARYTLFNKNQAA
jgi:hypothetical protein